MTIENIDPATLRSWLEAKRAVVVDVREPVEYEAEHIEGASLVPLGHLRRAALPDHPGRNLVIMCKAGGRGRAACQRLRAEMSPHETIYHLEGGLLAWKGAGFPVAQVEGRESHNQPDGSTGKRAAASGLGGFFRRLFFGRR